MVRLTLVALLTLSGCRFAVADLEVLPDHPTFQRDILPILTDHCLLCHGSHENYGAPLSDFDTYETAASLASEIVEQVQTDRMPPAAAWGDGLGPKAKAALTRWRDAGAPP